MFQCKIRNMPVIEDGTVQGIITMKLLADSSFNLLETGKCALCCVLVGGVLCERGTSGVNDISCACSACTQRFA